MVMVMVMVMRMRMRVGMAVIMRVERIMMVLMILCNHGCPHAMVVVMNITLMVIVVVNDQGARCALLMGMIVLMAMFMVVLMIVGVGMVVIIFMAGDPRLAASAYATHINLPRCR
nr:hypothetical protein [Aeromonas sp.]